MNQDLKYHEQKPGLNCGGDSTMPTSQANQLSEAQQLSLKLWNEHLTKIDDKSFLAQYLAVEKNVGPTVLEFFGNKPGMPDTEIAPVPSLE